MKKHIKNLTSGLVIVALSAIIIIWAVSAIMLFVEIPKESGYTAIVDFFAAVVGILIGLVAVYGIGWKYNKLTAKAEDEKAEKVAEAVECMKMGIGFNSVFGEDYTGTNSTKEG